MKQPENNSPHQPQLNEDESFFDTETVNTAQPVMPLEDTPTRAEARSQRLRAPLRRENGSFGGAFFVIALLAVVALGAIAGVLIYKASTDKATTETDSEAVNRTVQPQYQFIVEKPETQTAPKNNIAAPTAKKESPKKEDAAPAPAVNRRENAAPVEEFPEEEVVPEEIVQEDEIRQQERELRRERREERRREKQRSRRNNRDERQVPPFDEFPDGGIDQ